jgi:hypothetical protein
MEKLEWTVDKRFGKPFQFTTFDNSDMKEDLLVVFHIWKKGQKEFKTKGNLMQLINKFKNTNDINDPYYFAFIIINKADYDTIDPEKVPSRPF